MKMYVTMQRKKKVGLNFFLQNLITYIYSFDFGVTYMSLKYHFTPKNCNIIY